MVNIINYCIVDGKLNQIQGYANCVHYNCPANFSAEKNSTQEKYFEDSFLLHIDQKVN